MLFKHFLYGFIMQLNQAFVEEINKRLHLDGVPLRLAELETCCTMQRFDVNRCLEIIKVGNIALCYLSVQKYK